MASALSESDLSFDDEFLALSNILLVYKDIFALFLSLYAVVSCELYHREQGMIKNICGSSLNVEIIIIGLM